MFLQCLSRLCAPKEIMGERGERFIALPVPKDELDPLGPLGRARESRGCRSWAPEGGLEFVGLPPAPIVWQSQTRFANVQNQWDTFPQAISVQLEQAYGARQTACAILMNGIAFDIDFNNQTQTRRGYPDRVRTIRRVGAHPRCWIAAHFRSQNHVFIDDVGNSMIETGVGDRVVCGPERDQSVCTGVNSKGMTWYVDKQKNRMFSKARDVKWRVLMSLPKPVANIVGRLDTDAHGEVAPRSELFKKIVWWFDETKWGTRAKTQDFISHENLRVQRVHFGFNKRVYLQFMQKVQEYGANARCMLVFHGTDKQDNINAIITNNFSLNKIGSRTQNFGWFGKGIYFGRRAFTALGYNTGARMLAALVVVHKDKTFMCPPPDSSANPLHGQPCRPGFDSHLSPSGRELVVFDPRQVLPCFVLEFNTSDYGFSGLGCKDYYEHDLDQL